MNPARVLYRKVGSRAFYRSSTRPTVVRTLTTYARHIQDWARVARQRSVIGSRRGTWLHGESLFSNSYQQSRWHEEHGL